MLYCSLCVKMCTVVGQLQLHLRILKALKEEENILMYQNGLNGQLTADDK